MFVSANDSRSSCFTSGHQRAEQLVSGDRRRRLPASERVIHSNRGTLISSARSYRDNTTALLRWAVIKPGT